MSERQKGARYPVVGWLVAAAFVVVLNETVMLNAMPRVMSHFKVDENAAQWLSTIFMLTMAVVIPTTGWLLQRLRTRTVFVGAMSAFIAGTVLAAVAWAFPVLLIARVVQATGTAVMFPLLMTTIMAVVPLSDRGRVMGNVSLVMSVAPALGPAASGLILAVASWQWIFVIVLPIAVAVTFLGGRRLTKVGEPSVTRLDMASVVLAALGFGSLVYGLSGFGSPAGREAAPLWTVAGLAGVALFVWRQLLLQREDRPLLDLRALTIRTFTLAVILLSLSFMALFGSMILLQLYLQNLRGLEPVYSGLMVMPGALIMGLLGPRVGRWYDTHGAHVLMRPGAGLVFVAMSAAVLLDADFPLALVVLIHVAVCVGLALLLTPAFSIGLSVLPAQLHSHGSSILGTVQQVAGALGTAVTVMILSARALALEASGVTAEAAAVGGTRWAFAFTAGVLLVVAVVAWMMPERPAAPAPETGADSPNGELDEMHEPA